MNPKPGLHCDACGALIAGPYGVLKRGWQRVYLCGACWRAMLDRRAKKAAENPGISLTPEAKCGIG